jgi:putative transferase (TIGR04331 family)
MLKFFYGEKIRSISLESTYLNKTSLLKLFISLKSAPRFFRSWRIANLESSEKMRIWEFPKNRSSDFSEVLEFFLPKHIPRNFLEGFHLNREKCSELIKKFNPEILVTANDFADNDAWKFWAAECIETGSKLFITQHGGGYGLAKYLSTQNYEVSISDRFLSWGWQNETEPKIIRAPATKLIGIEQFTPTNNGYCLLVTASLPRRSYHLGSWPIGAQLENYIKDQFNFVDHLSDVVRRSLAVRLFPHDFGWEHASRWQDYNSEIELLPTRKDLDSYLGSTKLYISTYNATTFLEAFKKNIPTVIFWDPSFWEINEDANYYFKFLSEAKIFFDNPKEAAVHVNSIWNNVPLWWNSKEVRFAVSKFIDQFAYTGSNPLKELSAIILDLN